MGKVTKTAVDPNAYRSPSLFYRSAREGMDDLLRNIKSTRTRLRVLLPSYIGWSPHEGSGVLDPVRGGGHESVFYRIDGDDLSVDVDDFKERVIGGDIDVAVVIHYFGRTEPRLKEITDAAHDAGVLVVEDLAHAFFSQQNGAQAGRHGDVGIYSLHKLFPTPNSIGGMVTYRSADLLLDQEQTAGELASFLLAYDWNGIAAARRRNFLHLTAVLGSLPEHGDQFELLWPALDPFDVPQTLPVRILNGRRDTIYEFMNGAGYGMVSLYHTLVEDVRLFDEAMNLSATITNFPVHQDLTAEQIPPMVEVFRSSLGRV